MLITAMAVAMIVVGSSFIFVLLRGNERPVPQDGLQWAGVGLSVLLIACAGFLLLLSSVSGQGTPLDDTSLDLRRSEFGKPAGNFTFRLVSDGREQQLEAYEGQVVLLNFWATWCAPCLAELPDLNRLQERYGEEGLVVLTVSDEPRDELVRFEETMLPLITTNAFIPGRDVLPQPFRRTSAVRPATFIIDREGDIQAYVKGAGDYAYFEQLIQPYL